MLFQLMEPKVVFDELENKLNDYLIDREIDHQQRFDTIHHLHVFTNIHFKDTTVSYLYTNERNKPLQDCILSLSRPQGFHFIVFGISLIE